MNSQRELINAIFKLQDDNGFWKLIQEPHKCYPDYLHYVPGYRSTLWTLILLADLGSDPNDQRVKKPLEVLQNHFYDTEFGIFTLKKDHFPIPCLNGNMLYLDCYFNGKPGDKSRKVLEFFFSNQRFDDGSYVIKPGNFCTNKRCYGKHSCYWGIVKLLKGISFMPKEARTSETMNLLNRCIQFVLLHKVLYSSHQADKIMVPKMDLLTFPNMYRSDFLEILWLLKRENIGSPKLNSALQLLKSKQQKDGNWLLERQVHNIAIPIGQLNKPNQFITNRAKEVIEFYDNCT